MKFHN